MKMKTMWVVLAMVGAAAAAHAQGGTVTSGCGSSPENPTAVLALVGSAGGVLAAVRNRLRRR